MVAHQAVFVSLFSTNQVLTGNMTQLSTTERFLRLFTEVKPGEGRTALMMFANVFLILLAYYFIKPLREGWIAISDIEGLSKMEVKAYSSFAQSIILLFVVGWYARLSERWDRVTLFTRATLFCISNMVIFWFLQPNFFFEQLPLICVVQIDVKTVREHKFDPSQRIPGPRVLAKDTWKILGKNDLPRVRADLDCPADHPA